jgi:hypothetical protein
MDTWGRKCHGGLGDEMSWEISETCESFLDILVTINGDKLVTSVFYKPATPIQ